MTQEQQKRWSVLLDKRDAGQASSAEEDELNTLTNTWPKEQIVEHDEQICYGEALLVQKRTDREVKELLKKNEQKVKTTKATRRMILVDTNAWLFAEI